jgi:hypothetical protein
MPTLMNQGVYNATYEQARNLLAAGRRPEVITYQGMTPLFRYASAKNGAAAGNHAGARKIWSALDRDRYNRWTGYAHGGPGGAVGLYMTVEAEGSSNTIFSELAHYQPIEQGSPVELIEHFQYHREGRLEQLAQDAERLHFMFLFWLAKPLRMYKLELPVTQDDGSFVSEVFKATRDRAGNLFPAGKTCLDMYKDGEDASFCRAIGNACLADPGCDGLQVSSVRDVRSKGAVIKGISGQEIDFLQFVGRSSFFMGQNGTTSHALCTVADMQYNEAHGAAGYEGPAKADHGIIVNETFAL